MVSIERFGIRFSASIRPQLAELVADLLEPVPRLQQAIDAGQLDSSKLVDSDALLAAGVIRRPLDGVRLLAKGELKAGLTIEVAGASTAAVDAVEKAGGKITQTVVRDKAAIAAKADKRRARGKGKSAAADA